MDSPWTVITLPDAEYDLRGLPRNIRDAATELILSLAEDPFPPGSLQLEGWPELYRVRIDGWRLISDLLIWGRIRDQKRKPI